MIPTFIIFFSLFFVCGPLTASPVNHLDLIFFTLDEKQAVNQNDLKQANIKVKGTGKTIGDVILLEVTNRDKVNTLRFTVGPALVPGTKRSQPYIIPGTTDIVVPPGGTITVPIYGICIDPYKPPIRPDSGGPKFEDWISIKQIPKGWIPNPGSGWKPDPENTVLNPITGKPIGHTIDIYSHPEEAAPFILTLVESIINATDDLIAQGVINTPISDNPIMERELIIQQTLWITISGLAGNPYTVSEFETRAFDLIPSDNIPEEDSPEEEAIKAGIQDFWNTFQMVGERAKVSGIDHAIEETETGDWQFIEEDLFLELAENVVSEGIQGPIEILATSIVVPDGFSKDPENDEWVVPDATRLERGRTRIGPRRFPVSELDEPQFRDQPNGPRWQRRLIPEKIDLGNGIIVWLQKTPTTSYVNQRNGKEYRGGSFAVHFKWEGDRCRPGTWRQIYRETVFVGSSPDDLVPAVLTDGRYVPTDSPADATNDWTIDTNEDGRNNKNPDYPHQDNGEMIDTPRRAMERLVGYYSTDTQPRTRARSVAKEVEFITLMVGPDGEICSIMKWGFRVTWHIPEPHDPFDTSAMNHATVNTTYSGPRGVNPNSTEGQEAKNDYRETLENFLK